MKTKKVSRVLALLLSLMLLLGTLPAALAETSTVVTDAEYENLQAEAVQQYYDRLMATTTLAESEAIAQEIVNEQGLNFVAKLSDDQQAALEAKYDTLVAEYEASQTPTDTEEEIIDDRTIVYPTVDYTNAAPFGDPVEGAAPAMFALMRTATVAEETDNGLSLDKYISEPDENGVYTLTLEAWATGEKTTIKQESNIPTDIILVLDQSGSMTKKFTSTVYNKYTGTLTEMYSDRNDLYVKLSDGGYSPVTITRTSVATGNYSQYSGQTNSTYYSRANENTLYHKCSDGTYGKVTISRSGIFWPTYIYTCANGCTLGESTSGYNTTPTFNADLYIPETAYQYTFSYENENGQTVTESVMESASAPNWDFYQAQAGGNTTRLAALQSAVTTFADSVATKAKGADGTLGTADDVDHTISVVGFASGKSYNGQNYDYGNTEVFVGSDQYKYGTSARNQYTNVPQDMSTTAGVNNVTASINELAADGGTIINLGLEMAAGILEANPIPNGEKRNRVVIVFTDGIPGWSGYDDEVANSAITESNNIKSTYGATVYTVGIFEGADATSAGSSSGNDTPKANYFMQRLSSNTSYPQTPSYYLSASDSAALTSIFKTISQNIENGGSSVTLDEQAVVKDVLTDQFKLPTNADTDDIKVYTATYSEADTFEEPVEFTAATVAISEDGKTISVKNFDFAENWVGTETDADGKVTYRGKKLIIQIPIVVREDFLGGNNVTTNGTASGIYVTATDDTAIEYFDVPDVNVEVKKLKPVIVDENIYLGNEAVLTGLISGNGNDYKIGDKIYTVDGVNNAYVDIEYTFTDAAGNKIATYKIEDKATTGTLTVVNKDKLLLAEDATYKITCVVTPTNTGVYTATTDDNQGTVNVYKPVVTFQDSAEEYLATIDQTDVTDETSYYTANNYVSEVWKHGDTLSTDTGVKMTGTPPTINLTYKAATDWLDDNMKVIGTADVDVEVTATITSNDNPDVSNTFTVTSIRKACECEGVTCNHQADTEAENMGNKPEFVVHITGVAGNLKIVKTGLEQGESAIFTVSATLATESSPRTWTIVLTKTDDTNPSATITGLKAQSEYTVTEDAWSWSYTVTEPNNKTGQINAGGTVEVTYSNSKNDKWLTDESAAVNTYKNLTSGTTN